MIENRKIAAILAADVVGFSRLTGADEDRTLARLRTLRSDLIDPTIAVHKGRVVKRTGDGALVEFRSVVDAVRCAVEIQNAMVERNAGVPTDRRIEFRIGIHLGDVVEESDGDLMGGAIEDVFDLQDKITAAIIGIIEPNIQRAEIERAQRKRPESLDAYDHYARALPHLPSGMPDDANIGIGLLEEALKLDPKYAPAHAYLAWALEIRFVRGGFAESDATEGVRHARAALTYGGDDATALAVASLTLLHLGHDFAAASGAVTRALSLNASCATAFYFEAHVNAFSGDPAIAEEYANRALRLSPFDTYVYFAYQAKALGCVSAERHEEAAVNFAKARTPIRDLAGSPPSTRRRWH